MRKFFYTAAILISFLIVLILLSPFILRFSGMDIPVKNYLIKQVFVEYGHKINLQDVNFGIGRLEIGNLELKSSDKKLDIFIEKVDFDFSIINLIRNPSKPVNALENIYLVNPKLIFNRAKDSLVAEVYDENDQQNILDELSNIPQIENLIVKNGIISFQRKDSSLFNIASDLNGWLNTSDSKEIVLNLHGSAFDEENDNFNINATINTKDFSFNSRIDLNNYQLQDMNSLEINNYADIKNGEVDGFVKMSGNLKELGKVLLNGSVDLDDIEVDNDRFSISGFKASIKISNNNSKINGDFLFNKKELVEFEILNKNLLGGIFKGNIKSVSNDLSEFVFPEKNKPFRVISWESNFKTDLRNNKFEAVFSADSLIADNQKISLIRSAIDFVDGDLKVEGLNFVYNDFHFFGNGVYNDSLNKIRSSISFNMVAEEHVLLDRLSLAAHNALLSFNYEINSKKLSGNWNYSLTNPDTVLFASGRIGGDSLNVFFKMDSSNYKDFSLDFALSNPDNPSINYLNIDNFPFKSLTTDQLINDFFDQLITRFSIAGKFDDLKGDVYIGSRQYGDSLFFLTSNISDLGSDHIKIYGDAKINNLNGRYELDVGSGFLGSYFNFENEIDGNFFLDVNKDEQLSAAINFKKFKIYQVLLDHFPADDFRYQAVINGQVNLSGSLKDPQLMASLNGDKFVFNNLGYYQPDFDVRLSGTRLNVDTLKLYNNNKLVMDGFFNWSFLNDQIDGQLVGAEIELPYLLQTLNIDSSLVTGLANYSFKTLF